MAEQSTPPLSLDLIYAEVKERLSVQWQAIDSLDSKAGLVLSSASVVISIAAGLQASSSQTIQTVPLALLLAGGLLYVFCMVFGLRGFKIRGYRRDPEPGPLHKKYLHEEPELTKGTIIANLIESFEENKKLLDSKAGDIQRSMLFLALETGTLVAALMLQNILGD